MSCSSSQESSIFSSQESTTSSSSQESTTSSLDSGNATQETFFTGEDEERESKIVNRKRKRSVTNDEEGDDFIIRKKMPRVVSGISDLEKRAVLKFRKYLMTREGRSWFLNSDLKENLDTYSSDSDAEELYIASKAAMCVICYARPIDASIVHGRISHITTCYPCAKKLHSLKERCPICRRKIHMVTKNAYVS